MWGNKSHRERSMRAITYLSRAAGALFAATAATSVQAESIVDLITNTSGSANDAQFFRSGFQPAGSGVLQSFLRIGDNKEVVQGYNTDDRSYASNGVDPGNTKAQFEA